MKQLNRSECIPFAFRVYGTYEVETTLSDKNVHGIIDQLNPHLRSIETFNGKKRVRKFYAMSPEEAFSLLQSMAENHNCTDKLKLVQPTATEKKDEAVAEEIEKPTRGEFFSFERCRIPKGAVLSLGPYNDFKFKLKKCLDSLEQPLAIKCLELIFGLDITNYDDNVGQVSVAKDTFGFIVNAKYPSGIYFVNFGEFKKGDKVTFKVTNKYDKLRAINLKLIEEIE